MTALLAIVALLGTGAAQPQTRTPTPQPPSAAPVLATLYVIRYRPGPAYQSGVPLLRQDLRDHGRYMQDLARRGIILAAGPTFTPEGGIVLLRVASLDEARTIMAADPAISTGVFIGEVSDWRPAFDPGCRFRAD